MLDNLGKKVPSLHRPYCFTYSAKLSSLHEPIFHCRNFPGTVNLWGDSLRLHGWNWIQISSSKALINKHTVHETETHTCHIEEVYKRHGDGQVIGTRKKKHP